MKRGWYFCNGTCGEVVEFNSSAPCRTEHKRYKPFCSGSMHYLEVTEEEYVKYKPLIDEIGVLEFAKSLPAGRPLHKYLIAEWEKEMGITWM